MLKMIDLYAIQQEVYHAAAKYHGALAEYAAALHPDNQSRRLKEEADKCISAGEEYRVRLQDLLDYALTTGASEVDEQEIQRIRKLIELLDLEMERIRVR
jgi:hypothetical protein